ncbi:hypothetical protein BD413DRAFT_36140 [Trametes elegans]|nr:hypothetical protein BD413DRAFT_36140 [Trametes elegans]
MSVAAYHPPGKSSGWVYNSSHPAHTLNSGHSPQRRRVNRTLLYSSTKTSSPISHTMRKSGPACTTTPQVLMFSPSPNRHNAPTALRVTRPSSSCARARDDHQASPSWTRRGTRSPPPGSLVANASQPTRCAPGAGIPSHGWGHARRTSRAYILAGRALSHAPISPWYIRRAKPELGPELRLVSERVGFLR